jgi:hypothetical protein
MASIRAHATAVPMVAASIVPQQQGRGLGACPHWPVLTSQQLTGLQLSTEETERWWLPRDTNSRLDLESAEAWLGVNIGSVQRGSAQGGSVHEVGRCLTPLTPEASLDALELAVRVAGAKPQGRRHEVLRPAARYPREPAEPRFGSSEIPHVQASSRKILTSKGVLEGERKEAPGDIRTSHSNHRRRCPHRAGSPDAEAGSNDSEGLHGDTADLTT